MYDLTQFVSKKVAQAFHEPKGRDTRILISLTTPGDPNDRPHSSYCKPAVLHEDTWKAVLRLEFHDVDPKDLNPYDACGYRLFNEDDAVKVLNFLKQHEDDTFEAIVHCEAGISRSAGVAKFIAQIYNLPFNQSYSVYNKHVFSTLMRVYGESSYGEGPIPIENLPGVKA